MVPIILILFLVPVIASIIIYKGLLFVHCMRAVEMVNYPLINC